MIVICKKVTKRLIKGHRYEIESLYNSGGNNRWIEGKLTLKGVNGRFSVDNFTDTSGMDIPLININTHPLNTFPELDFDSLKKVIFWFAHLTHIHFLRKTVCIG